MERDISNEDIRITTFPGKWDEEDLAKSSTDGKVEEEKLAANMAEVNVASQ